ncbi:hypothetical protein NDU88_000694 [Pleurodeles waltl]|uniref:Uncharacterized protein n=1 Tax=Pleurodeles waltl TaxID=8319 RepID=A0AAV7VWU1_PLEWA|nr:hypothetical protein NDU88_000694 [Pleurodeles waltl]
MKMRRAGCARAHELRGIPGKEFLIDTLVTTWEGSGWTNPVDICKAMVKELIDFKARTRQFNYSRGIGISLVTQLPASGTGKTFTTPVCTLQVEPELQRQSSVIG